MRPRKQAVLGAAMCSLTSIALAAGIASGTSGAKNPGPGGIPVNVSDYSLSCRAVSAKFNFDPVLKQPGPIGVPGAVTLKLKTANCTASPPPSGGPTVSISKASTTGTLTISNDSCAGFLGGAALSGSLTVMYKTPHGSAPLAAGSQTTEVTLGSFSTALNGSVLVFKDPGPNGLPAVQSIGAFTGTDNGRSSTLSITDGTFSAQKCARPSGLKTLKFRSGTLNLG